MARPRKPTRLLELTGAFKKHPERRQERIGEPRPDPEIGPAPEGLSAEVLSFWEEIVAAAPPGVLTRADAAAVRAAARLMAIEKSGEAGLGERTLLKSYLNDFGMTPKGRTYIKTTVNPDEQKNEFADI